MAGRLIVLLHLLKGFCFPFVLLCSASKPAFLNQRPATSGTHHWYCISLLLFFLSLRLPKRRHLNRLIVSSPALSSLPYLSLLLPVHDSYCDRCCSYSPSPHEMMPRAQGQAFSLAISFWHPFFSYVLRAPQRLSLQTPHCFCCSHCTFSLAPAVLLILSWDAF